MYGLYFHVRVIFQAKHLVSGDLSNLEQFHFGDTKHFLDGNARISLRNNHYISTK